MPLRITCRRMLARRCPTCSRPRSTRRSARARAGSRRRTSRRTAPQWEEDEEFPIELYRTAAAAGITGHRLSRGASAGRAATSAHVLVACDELIARRALGRHASSGSAATASRCRRSSGSARPSSTRGSSRRACADGKIAALAITEPGGGSDVAALATRAERDGDHYVVTGAKTFITSGTRADFVTTAVRTGGAGPRRHLAARDRARHAGLRGGEEAARRPAGGRATPPSCTSTAAACRSRTGSARRTARSR